MWALCFSSNLYPKFRVKLRPPLALKGQQVEACPERSTPVVGVARTYRTTTRQSIVRVGVSAGTTGSVPG